MKTNFFRSVRAMACVAWLALGVNTAFAATETIEFADEIGSGTVIKDVDFLVVPATEAAGVSDSEVLVNCDGTTYINGTIPYSTTDWRITSITINDAKVTDGNLAIACAVNGVEYTASGYTFTGNTLSEGVVGIKLSGSGMLHFTTITIEYEQVSVPQITWSSSDDDNITATSTVTMAFSEPMYINGTLISQASLALVAGEITLSDYEENAVEKTVKVNSDKQIVVTTTGVKICGQMYQIAVSNLIVNSAGVQVYKNLRSEAQIAHEETITATGKGIDGSTLYVGETFTPAEDLTITADGTDVTADCTFGNISTASAGEKMLTVTHGLCTKEVAITVTEREQCTITWLNEVTGETLAQNTVKQGVTLYDNGITTLPKPTTTVLATDCGQKAFVGWSTSAISGSTDNVPSLITTASVPIKAEYTLHAVYADGSSEVTDGWAQITSTDELAALVGKEILIANTEKGRVMGEATQKNFKSVKATIAADGSLTPASGYIAVTLGGSTGAWTFKTDAGYLYCASSISTKGNRTNKLAVQSSLDDNGKWTIEFTSGELFVRSVGCTYVNNRMLYNTNNNATGTEPIFSCYEKTDGTAVLPISLYRSNATRTGYITKCSCTVPTWSGTLPTAIGKGASLAFGITSNSTGAITYSCSDADVTITGDKFQVAADGSYSIVITQAAAGDYCAKTETRTMTITVGDCSAQSFHYGIKDQSDWNYLCFDADTDDRHIYNFTIPTDASHYYVGWQKTWDSYKSETVDFQYMPFALLQGKCTTTVGWGTGVGQGAVGTLRIYNNYTDKNWYIGFIPDGYVLRLSSGSAWSSMAFAATNDAKTVWETELVTLTADNLAGNYYVDLKANNTDGHVWCNNSEEKALNTMGTYANGWGSNLSAANVGAKGKFRTWADNCDGKNWLCHFVPYYDITYMNADNSTVFATSDAVSAEAESLTMTVIATNPTKSGYRFVGWSETQGATTADYTAGGTITLSKNHVFYPVFVQQVTLTYNANGGTTECGNVAYDINATATLCTDGAERAGYRFDGWSTTQDDASTKVTSVTMSESHTLYALWTKYLTVTYITTNMTLADGCTAVQADKVAGETVTLCAAPTSTLGYTFEKWIVTTTDGTQTEYDAGASFALTSDATVQARWDVPDIVFTFVNQGAGDQVQKTVQVAVPMDTYVTAPTSVTVPTNCDGKVFIGWANIQIDDETTYQDIDALTAAGHKFLYPGDKMLATESTDTAPRTWYAVFAKTE